MFNCLHFSRAFLETKKDEKSLLVIQCIYSEESVNLVTCAQHICMEAMHMYGKESSNVYFLFLLQLSHLKGGYKGINSTQSAWKCIHIDELRPPCDEFPSLLHHAGSSLSCLFDYDQMKGDEQYIEVTTLIKRCIPTATKKLCELKEMSNDDISSMISLLNKIMAYVSAGYHHDEGGSSFFK